MHTLPHTSQSTGQTLIEVIVMLAVVVMMVTGLVIGMTASLKSTTFSSEKSNATKYAQEAMELVRQDRNASWSTFLARDGKNFCLGTDLVFVQSNSCTTNVANTYTRSLRYTWDELTEKMTVTVVVTWKSGQNVHTSQITSAFTKWR